VSSLTDARERRENRGTLPASVVALVHDVFELLVSGLAAG
jgi:hypothetical protein